MTEQAQTPPAGTVTPPVGTRPPAGEAPQVAVKPDFLPTEFWDEKAGIKTDEFAKHYGELSAAQQKLAERAAAVPEKPEGYKIEVKLPEGVKPPEGITFDPSKDPRTPQFLKVAHTLGLDNNQVNALVALDAEQQIAAHGAEQARVAEEMKKLGDNAQARVTAANSWLSGQTGDGKTFTADEAAELRLIAGSAAGVSAIEKLIAKATGGVPGVTQLRDPSPAPKSVADRIWPTGFSSTPQAKVG